MDSDVEVTWDESGQTRPADEIYTALSMPTPESAPPQDTDPVSLGTAVARRGGVLLGWAETYRHPRADARGGVLAQADPAPRFTRRLVRGFYDQEPSTDEEHHVVELLFGCAARHLQAAGHHLLWWSGPDTGPEGSAARALGASPCDTHARMWRTEPGRHQKPTGLPDVQARLIAAPVPGAVNAPITLALAADHGAAEITASVDGARAYLNAAESITHHGADASTLAALICALIAQLRTACPDVEELLPFEFDDGLLRQALDLSGLKIATRFEDYELPLTAKRDLHGLDQRGQ